MTTTGSSFSTRFCSARRSAGGTAWVNQRRASLAPAKRLIGNGIFGWSVNRSAASSRPAARTWTPCCREISSETVRGFGVKATKVSSRRASFWSSSRSCATASAVEYPVNALPAGRSSFSVQVLGLALVEMRDGRLAGAEVDLDPPEVRLAAALDPAEAVLCELGLQAQPVVLDGDAAVLEAPHRVHDEPVALELLGELAIGDELAALIAHRGKAVQVGLRIPQRHAPARQGKEQGAERQRSSDRVHRRTMGIGRSERRATGRQAAGCPSRSAKARWRSGLRGPDQTGLSPFLPARQGALPRQGCRRAAGSRTNASRPATPWGSWRRGCRGSTDRRRRRARR